MSVRRAPTLLLAALLSLTWIVVTAAPASAACHVAGFVESSVEAGEADATAVLVVELRGRVATCEGTVDVATVAGTATAGSDFEAFSATLEFVAGDDRVEMVEVVLLDDEEAEGQETFTVELSNPTGSISSTGEAATVTVADDDGAAADDAVPEDEPDATDTDADDDVAAESTEDAADAGVGLMVPIVIVAAVLLIALAAVLGSRGRAG